MLSLIEDLEVHGIDVISANTDGVISIIKDRGVYESVCKSWMIKTGFELEFSEYDLYVRRDVNNYISLSVDGKIKKKGIFDDKVYLEKGYSPSIIPKALKSYFIDNTSVDEFLDSSKNIYDYFLSQQVGKKFQVFTRDKFGKLTRQQKVSRYYACLSGEEILKKEKDREISMCSSPVVVMNQVGNYKFEDLDVNLKFYEDEISKIIHKIEPRGPQQLTLF